MEDVAWGEAAEEATVAPPAFIIRPMYSVYPEVLLKLRWLESLYQKSGDLQWRDDAVLYYRDALNEKEKDEFLKVSVSDLDYLCCNRKPSWLRNMLTDVVTFLKLHDKWEAYICPSDDCFCLFSEADSLVLHLMNEHCKAWPSLQQDPIVEHSSAMILCSAEWKPIDVRVALNTLFTLPFLNLHSLEWPLSEDFKRNELLADLQRKFLLLLNLEFRGRDSITLWSNGWLRALIAVASEEALRCLDPTDVLPRPIREVLLIGLLHCNPVPFRFTEEEPLCSILKFVEGMCDFIEDQASENRESETEGSQDGDVKRSQNNCFDAVSVPAGFDYFVLDVAKLKLCGIDEQHMGSWLFEMPIFPTISKLPARASLTLQQLQRKAVSFSKCLTQNGLNSASVISWSKIHWNTGHWPTPLLGKLSPGFDYQHYLELLKLTCELQFFELQVCRICAVDLREYILPLLRSYLRMKLYMAIRIGPWTGDVEEEYADEVNILEWPQEEHPEEHHSKVKGEPAAEDGIDVMTPCLSSYNRSKELPTTPPELGSISDLDPMMVDGGEPLGEKASGPSAGDADSTASQVGSADAAPSRSRTGIAAAIAQSMAKPEALPELDAEPELKAEPESQWSQEFEGPLCCESDFDISESSGESNKEGHEREQFPDAVWFMREKSAWETKDDGLFICMTINDVVKDCLEKMNLDTALNIWGLKTNRNSKNWCCFICGKVFPDQKSHMWHMESKHGFVPSWALDLLVPVEVLQRQSVVNEGVRERTCSLDDSITVDCAYRTFLVEMKKFGYSLQHKEEGQVPNGKEWNALYRIVVFLLSTIHQLIEIGKHDAELLRRFIQLHIMQQNLSDLSVSDFKNEILHSISSFLKKRKLLDRGLRTWALQKLNESLLDVRCKSLSVKLTSPGKVIINIEEHNAVMGFSYVGICWEFSGDLSFEGSRNIMGTFVFSGASTADGGFLDDNDVILDEESKTTTEGFEVEMEFMWDLREKLYQFQAEFTSRLQGLEG